jgi:hypothetical protein
MSPHHPPPPLLAQVTAHHYTSTLDDNECFDLALKNFQTRINKRHFAKLRALYYGCKGSAVGP